jgi:hypothetical protein
MRIEGSCHCGETVFEVTEAPSSVTRCTCSLCAKRGCGTYSESPDWSTGKPDFDNPRVGVNARLFDEFDLEAVPVNVIDGKNLW